VERSIEIAKAIDSDGHVARGVALRASILHDLGEMEAAADGFAELHSMDEGLKARRGLWEAEHLLLIGRRNEAVEMTRVNLEECSFHGWAGHVAHAHTVLGLAAAESDPAGAAAHLAEARRWVAVSGEVEMALRISWLAAEIALAAGHFDEAAREAHEGEFRARVSGFRLFRTRLSVLAARAAIARGDERAVERASAALSSAAAEDAWGRADATHWLGVALLAAGERGFAKETLSDALAMRARLRHPGLEGTREELARGS
jgi:tetratricopeptide (TPR) repeat protein